MEMRKELSLTLKILEDFVHREQIRAGESKGDFNGRDETFLSKARQAIESGEESSLRSLLEEMRGLSHYFCSYSGDTKTLDCLLNDLFVGIQKALHTR